MALIVAGLGLTIEDMHRAISTPYRAVPSFYDLLEAALADPTPHLVQYCVRNKRGRWFYTPPDRIFIAPRENLPSDCTWMVPNLPGSGR